MFNHLPPNGSRRPSARGLAAAGGAFAAVTPQPRVCVVHVVLDSKKAARGPGCAGDLGPGSSFLMLPPYKVQHLQTCRVFTGAPRSVFGCRSTFSRWRRRAAPPTATSHMQPVAFLPCDSPVCSPYHACPELPPPCLRPVSPRQWFSLTRHHAALALADRHVAEAFCLHCYTRRGSVGPAAAGPWLAAAAATAGGAAGAVKATVEDARGALGPNVSVVEGPADAGLVHAGGGEDEGTQTGATLGRAGKGGSGGGDGGGDRRRLLGGQRGILRRLAAAGRVDALGHVALAG